MFLNVRNKLKAALISHAAKRLLHNVNLEIDGIQLSHYIRKLQAEYEELQAVKAKTTRLRQLRPIISLLEERKYLVESTRHLHDLLHDADEGIRLLAQEEQSENESKIREVDEKLKESLLPLDTQDACNNIVLEVNSGVGGQEAMLFAAEVFDMYKNFAVFKRWTCEVAEYAQTESGGIRHAAMLLSGEDVFRHMKHEAGVHRVQRIPATEKSGRVHTSTVSVVAVPQPDEIHVRLEAKDLRFETKRATGAGGQHVNTTDSAVRVVHLPSGVAVECQTNRSQVKNKEVALQRLRAKLYQMQLDAQVANEEATRKMQVRSNFRNEKIRTYNFNQDRITDHRLINGHNVHNLKGFMQGGESLQALIDRIDYQRRIDLLKELVEE